MQNINGFFEFKLKKCKMDQKCVSLLKKMSNFQAKTQFEEFKY